MTEPRSGFQDKRGGDRIISRMYSVNPADPEKFHLRLLLLHVPGATSYDDLKTVSGEVCLTFRDACIRRHLLTDDSEYNDALMEASQFQMPRQLRSMFATICTYCQPSDPITLWTTHTDALIEDFARHHTHEAAVNQALHDINRLLQENGLSCASIGLPLPQGEFNDVHVSTDLSEPPPSFDDLNREQQHVVEAVLQSVMNAEGEDGTPSRLHYIDAPGGCGKTYVFNKLAAYLRHHNKKVACAAWTGIATTLMPEGRTVHSLFKLPVPVLENSTCNVAPTSEHAQMLRGVDLFITDEASMIPSHALHAIDRCLQDITGVASPLEVKYFFLVETSDRFSLWFHEYLQQ